MPIRRELRDLYPAHWRELSRRVRFERAGGLCQGCGRPHGATVRACRTGGGTIREKTRGGTGAAAPPGGPTSNR
jgi:hypothetical protein